MKLLSNQPGRETVFGWLKAVARNEAVRLDRLQRRLVQAEHADGVSLSAEPEAQRSRVETAQGLLEVRERLEQLPERQRELVFLTAAGWRYNELAERSGVNVATSRRRAIRQCSTTGGTAPAPPEVESTKPRGTAGAAFRYQGPSRERSSAAAAS